jgi:predicted alpha/beta superfamily hydrolase
MTMTKTLAWLASIGVLAVGAFYFHEPPRPRPHTAQPNVQILAEMTIPGLGRQRRVRLYLPPGYAESERRYPVLYMHDGQNLFDAATSFLGEWNVDESLNDLAQRRHIELIVVGIDNGGDHRMQELAPFESVKHDRPEGDAYLDFIVHTVKPYIDAHYRTRTDRTNTAIMGSSLGGLISHYAICRYPDVFSKAGVLSPAYWFTPPIYDYVAAHLPPNDTKVYFYAGGAEDESMVPNMRRMIALLHGRGIPQSGVAVHVVPEAKHNEDAWRSEFPQAIEWLFGQ